MSNDGIFWKNHFVELVVVFIGISTAFMLNNWREDEKDRDREQLYINSFYAEISSDGNRLDTIIERNEQKLRIVTRTVERLGRADAPEDSLMLAVSQMVHISLFIPKTNVYESAKFSGSFNLIEDNSLRTRLIGYYEKYEGKELVEEYYRMYIDRYILPFLFEHVDMVEGKILNMESVSQVKLKNLIVGYHQLLRQLVEFYHELVDSNKALLKEISEKYEVVKT